MTIDEQVNALTAIAAYTRKLGFGGVMILSPICKDCGDMHDFRMLADWHVKQGDDDIDALAIRRLLLRFADIAMTTPEADDISLNDLSSTVN